jgi:hypothetical protein
MKIQKNGKTVTIDREELEVLVKHLGEFEKLVKTFERLEAAGKLPSDLQRQWAGLQKFLGAEEARIAGAGAQATTRERRKKRCCVLSNEPLTNVVDCRETNTLFVFALTACLAAALAGGFGATLSTGSCADVGGCF